MKRAERQSIDMHHEKASIMDKILFDKDVRDLTGQEIEELANFIDCQLDNYYDNRREIEHTNVVKHFQRYL